MIDMIARAQKHPGRQLLYILLAAGLSLGLFFAEGRAAGQGSPHPYIGIYMQRLTESIARGMGLEVGKGVLVADVEEKGPADEAGIEEGDVIIEFDGEKVTSPRELKELVERSKIGEKVSVKLIRGNAKKKLSLVVGEAPEEEEYVIELPEDVPALAREFVTLFNPSKRLGVRVEEMGEELAEYFGVKEDEGVLVLEVEDDSPAEKAGIKPGDVIMALDGDKIDSVEDLREEVGSLEEGEEFRVDVVRHGKKLELSGKIEERKPIRWVFKRHCIDRPIYRMRGGTMEELKEKIGELEEKIEKLEEKLREHRK